METYLYLLLLFSYISYKMKKGEKREPLKIKIIKATNTNSQGKTTFPKEFIKEWKIVGKQAKMSNKTALKSLAISNK